MSMVDCCSICACYLLSDKPHYDILGHKVCDRCSDIVFDYLKVQAMKDLFAQHISKGDIKNAGNF